jgi:hypothetical protein
MQRRFHDEKIMVSPYTIHIREERLEAIKSRVEAYDWSQLPDAGGWKAGVGIADLQRLVAYAKAQRHVDPPERTIWDVFEEERGKLVEYRGPFDGFHTVPPR